MNSHYTYLLVLACSVAGPLLLSFDRKVFFYKKWKWVFAAMLLPAAGYIIWDVIFTKLGVWSFNDNYIMGPRFFGLPLEETAFFFIIPYCCLFVYECVITYANPVNSVSGRKILWILALLLLITGCIFYDRYYTSVTFWLFGFFLFLTLVTMKWITDIHLNTFLIAYALILLPFMAVNGILTSLPVVVYNDAENLDLRIYTIPIEDIIYGMLLFLLNIVIYEKMIKRDLIR